MNRLFFSVILFFSIYSQAGNYHFEGAQAQIVKEKIQANFSLQCESRACALQVEGLNCQFWQKGYVFKQCSGDFLDSQGTPAVVVIADEKAEQIRDLLLSIGLQERTSEAGGILQKTITTKKIQCSSAAAICDISY